MPIATHVLSVVHATFVSGTEMLKAGSPETRGTTVTVAVAHEVKTNPATRHSAAIRTPGRTWAGTRIIASLSW